MKTIIVLSLFLLTTTPVWACDSYESCIEIINNYDKTITRQGAMELYPLKAIAYKLDEISKKLDKKEEKTAYKSYGVKV